MKIRIAAFLILTLIPISSFAQNHLCGLKFLSHQVSKEMRTSLYLEDDKGIKVGNYFNLTFEYSFYQNKKGRFGQICKINIGNGSTVDFVYNIKNVRDNYLALLVDGQIVREWAVDSDYIMKDEWNRMSITLLPKEHRIMVLNNSDTLSVTHNAIGRNDRVRFFFGAVKGNSSKDVSSFILGDVILSIKPGKEKFHWNMNRHGEAYVIDNIDRKKLIAENPEWLIDNHIRWELEKSVILPRFHFVSDNDENLYIITEDSLNVYSLSDKEFVGYGFKNTINLLKTSNHFVWNEGRLEYLNINDVSCVRSVFDPASGTWRPAIVSDNRKSIHANIIAYGEDYMQLFGYGFHKYSDRIYRMKNDESVRLNDPIKIPPRYLSAVGINDGKLYIYSGVGNKSGEQISGADIYNDFYSIDLTTMEIKALPSFPELCHEVAAENLIFDCKGEFFYALFFNPFKDKSCLQLKKIDMVTGKVTDLADGIPYLFSDINSEARLSFSKKENKIYAITKHIRDERAYEYELNVYSVHFPVLNRDDVLLADTAKSKSWWVWLMVSILAVSALSAGAYLISRRKRKHIEPPVSDFSEIEDTLLPEKEHKVEEKATGVYLLGGFAVIDKNGENITGKFTSVTTQLLCLIILYTVRNKKGIPSVVLKDILWSDKSDESALNNRSVNIRKVRKLLEEVGGYTIVHENSYWEFVVPDDMPCDVVSSVAFLKKFNSKKYVPDESVLGQLLAICSKGGLLTDLHYDWLDDFKFSYNTMVIDAFNKALSVMSDNVMRVSFVNAIMRLSPLDEDALKVKCNALIALGKNGLAKAAFDAFAKEYEATMGEVLPYTFESICTSKRKTN